MAFRGPLIGVGVEAATILPVFDFARPASVTRSFTTCRDRQSTAAFCFYVRQTAADPWMSVGEVTVDGLPPLPAGRPTLLLRVSPAGSNEVTVSIGEGLTGSKQAFTLLAPKAKPAVTVPARGRLARSWPWVPVAVTLSCLALLTATGWFLLRPVILRQRAVHSRVVAPAREQRPIQAGPSAREQRPIQAGPPTRTEVVPTGGAQGPRAVAPPVEARGGSIEAPEAPGRREEESGETPLTYRVLWGDTLWDIARRYYGDPHLYRLLARENGIRDPNRIVSGWELHLPAQISSQRRRANGGR